MFQVYGVKNIVYHHVGSPRVRSEGRWGEVFDHEADCQRACDALKAQHGVQFLTIYPREVAQPMEQNFNDHDDARHDS